MYRILSQNEHEDGAGPSEIEIGSGKDDELDLKRWKRRHVVAILALLGFANIYAMRANLSIAIVEMTTGGEKRVNGTTLHVHGDFENWTPMTQGVVLSSFFYGYIVSQLPGGYLAYTHGAKNVFFAGTFGTAVFTLLTPPFARMGYGMLVFARFMEGLLEGVTYPAMHVIWSRWAPPLEQTKLATFAFSGSYFGTVIAMPLSAYLGEHFGWPMIFWFFGALGVIWCTVWYKTVVPWGQILRSKPVWAIIIAHSAQNLGFYIMLTNLPRMLKDIAGYNVEKAGLASSLPYFLMGFQIITGGQLCDYLRKNKHYDTLFVRKMACALGFIGQSVFLFLVMTTSNSLLLVLFFSISIGLGGICWCGFSVNHLDLAPQYAGHLMAASNTFATIPGIFGPLLVGAIVENGTIPEWNVIMYIIISVYLIGAAAFWKLAEASLQPWASDHTSFVGQLE